MRVGAVVLPVVIACLAHAETIRGIVADPSGALVPGASVKLLISGIPAASARTGPLGDYSLEFDRPAAPAEYAITVDASGFLPATRTLSPEEAGQGPVRFTLEMAPYRQSVEVGARTEQYQATLDMTGVRESAAKDVGEALTSLDGVWKIRKAGIANDLVIRGFQQNNIAVLVDGSRTYGACPGHMDPPSQHVDFAEVDHVDVVKGAFDVENQGGLGAVVSIATRSPGQGFSLRPSFSAGSFGYYNPSIVASYGGRTVRLLAGYSFRRSDPYRDGSGKPFTDYAKYSADGLTRPAFEVHTGWLETEVSLSDRQTLLLSYTRQQAGHILYPYLSMDSDYDNADRGTLRYTARGIASGLRNLRLEAYFTQVNHFMSDSERVSAMNGAWTMASDAGTRTAGGRAEADLGRDFTAGVESYYRNWNVLGYMKTAMTTMTSPSIPNVDTHAWGSFVSYHHTLSERVHLSGGLRFDRDTMQATTPAVPTNLYYQFHNTRQISNLDTYPSGNLRATFSLPKAVEWFAGAGTAGRIPDAAERYMQRGMGAVTVGNPLLPYVRNTEISTGINVTHDRFYFRPDFFYSFLNNYIIVNDQPQQNAVGMTMGSMAAPAPAARSYTNIGARIYGGELCYGYSFSAALSLAGGGSYSRGVAALNPMANVTSPNLAEMPPLRGWTSLRYALRWVFAEIGGVAVNRQSLVDSDLKESPTAGYGLMNLKFGFTHRKLSGSFTVDNLLNRFYYEHFSYYRDPFSAGVKIPEPGRQLFAQLRYAF